MRNEFLQCQHRGEAGDGVLDGGIVDEGDGIFAHFSFMLEMDGGLIAFLLDSPHLERYPSDVIRQSLCAPMDGGIIGIDNHRLAVGKELHLLGTLDVVTHEVLLMCCAQIGHHTNGGLHDTFQFRHFSRLGDASLDDGEVVVGIDEPHAQWHTHLTIVTARRTAYIEVGRKQLIQPFFHRRLAV